MSSAKQSPAADGSAVSVTTGNAAIDEAFRISVALVNELRPQYHAASGIRGWLPVSGGMRGKMVGFHDQRDSAHAVKMAAYLWGGEPDQAGVVEKAFGLDQVQPETGAVCDAAQSTSCRRRAAWWWTSSTCPTPSAASKAACRPRRWASPSITTTGATSAGPVWAPATWRSAAPCRPGGTSRWNWRPYKAIMRTLDHHVDVCVVGGGLAGLCAAVAAARRGEGRP